MINREKNAGTSTKKLVSAAVVAVAILLTGVGMFKATAGTESPSVSINGGTWSNVFFGTPAESEQPSNMVFGSAAGDTTNFTALATTEDMTVGRNLTVAGTTAFTGTTTLSGEVSGIPKSLVTTMSSSATTTACSPINTTGADRIVVAAGVSDTGTAASTGSITWQAGTSTAAGVAAATKAVNTALTRVSGLAIITTTSTPQLTGYVQWRSGERFNFISSTTTNAGSCKLLFY